MDNANTPSAYTRDVIAFFDRLAPNWDAAQIDRYAVIESILDNAGVGAGQRVLDVACGTGILFEHYLRRGVASVTGVDISPEMAKLAARKAAGHPQIRVVCGDIERVTLDTPFDAVVVYNAFPHFEDGARLIEGLWDRLAEGGRLTVAHGFSRETINARHGSDAHRVSQGLMPADDLAALFRPRFDVDVVISNGEMYQVAGTKKG